VVAPLDAGEAVHVAQELVADGVESLAICFLNSYRNPEHERLARDAIAAALPDIPVCASVDSLPEVKEYERTSTTVVNAYLLPVMRRYLERLRQGLSDLGVAAPLLIVSSGGGLAAVETAAAKPVFFVGSGPAAGVVGAARAGAAAGIRDLIAFDMGGTTAKASLVADSEIARTSEYEFREGISTPSRFIKAGGYLLKVPAIDVAEVGAGAGSIARVDAGGLLTVGPDSAGAEPGPASYGRGGTKPTVTDANLVLGYLDPAGLAGGDLAVDPELARAAIERDVATPLGISVDAAALGIRRVANASMVRALRSVTVERGVDPRQCTLVAFGGSGPVHAVDLAVQLAMTRILVPPLPGVFTAVGMLEGELESQRVLAWPGSVDRLLEPEVGLALERMAADAADELPPHGSAVQTVTCEANLRLRGQDNDLPVAFDPAELVASGSGPVARRFFAAYARTYGYEVDEPVELSSLRVIVRRALPGAQAKPARSGEGMSRPRRALLEGHGWQDVTVIRRDTVLDGAVPGPLLVESYDSTVVVPPGWSARSDVAGNLVLEAAP
jgi:N-methylhydantoinase A